MRPRWEDGTSGRPLGDDEDLDPYVPGDLSPDYGDFYDEMTAEERKAAARGVVPRFTRPRPVGRDGFPEDQQP